MDIDSRGKLRREFAWQRALLPLMRGTLVVLAAFFFVSTLVELYTIQGRIDEVPAVAATPVIDAQLLRDPAFSSAERIELLRWQTLSALEQGIVARRYHQANMHLMSRLWIQYIGFITGMILCMVGAAFVLGRLRDDTASQLNAEAEKWKLAFASSSPGLFMLVLGTGLMLATIFVNHAIRVEDVPLYLGGNVPGAAAPSAAAPPAPWPQARAPAGAAQGEDPMADLAAKLRRADEAASPGAPAPARP
jgi:hypothetical protein